MPATIEEYLNGRCKVVYFVLIAIYFSTGCIQFFGLLRFYSIRRLLIVRKRYPNLVLVEAMMCCIALFIMSPITINSGLNAIDFSSFGMERLFKFCGIVLEGVPLAVVVIESSRIYLMSYDLQHLHSSKNHRWKSQIDVSYAEKDWYLRNRQKYGNQHYVVRMALIYYLMTSTIVMTLHITFEAMNTPQHLWIFNGVNALFYLCPIVTVFCVYVHCPREIELGDRFLFQYEIKWTTRLWFGGFILYVISTGLLFIHLNKLSFTLTALLMVGSVYSSSLLSTVWIPFQITMMDAWNGTRCLRSRTTTSISSKSRRSQYFGKGNDGKIQRQSTGTMEVMQRLKDTLKNEVKFEAFCDWMFREFSSESLLSFIEFIEFKHWLKEEIRKSGGMVVSLESDPEDFKLYDKMPRSSIVYDEQHGNDCDEMKESISKMVVVYESTESGGNPEERYRVERAKRISHLLYLKYIDIGSEFELNIGGSLREKYAVLDQSNYGDLSLLEFVSVFDELIGEMVQYLRQSFVRFDCALHQELVFGDIISDINTATP